jgi:hypothetical protein
MAIRGNPIASLFAGCSMSAMSDEIKPPGEVTPPAEPETDPAPPVARVVVEASKTERELLLERDLEAEKAARKKAETDAAHAQDEVHRLTAPTPGTSPPANDKPKRNTVRSRIFSFGRDED